MSRDIDLKNLWSQQKSQPPDMRDLLLKMKQLKKSSLRSLIITNILLITTAIFIVFIWIYYQPQKMTTKLGIIMVVLAMVIYLLVYNKSVSLLRSTSDNQSSSDYLKQLLQFKKQQQFLLGRILTLYFILLSGGLCLYMYEYAMLMSAVNGIIAYVATFAWIAFAWFYLRPKEIKKQQSKLDHVIHKFQDMQKQLAQE